MNHLYIKRRPEDVWVGNFEGVTSKNSCNIGFHRDSFRVEPIVLGKIRNLDYYGFANNHAMEHGPEAYEETVVILKEMGSKVFGTQENKTVMFEHQGRKVAITGMSQRVENNKIAPITGITLSMRKFTTRYESNLQMLLRSCLCTGAMSISTIHQRRRRNLLIGWLI